MNRTKIEWCDYTWNPVVGCKNGCSYCYARKIYTRFNSPDGSFSDIKVYEDRLYQPLKVKKPSIIFVGSMTDLFAQWMNTEHYVNRILDVIRECPRHTFIFLTKSPLGYKRIKKYPKNCWLGVTVTGVDDWRKTAALHTFKRDNLKFISIEPILDTIATGYFWLADWVILGGLTPKSVHKQKWIKDFLDLGKKSNVPVFMKKNLNWRGKLRQEFPK